MELQKLIIPFLTGVAIVACGIVTFQIGKAGGYQRGYNEALNLPHKPDTVWKDKPVYIDRPVPVVQWKEREKIVYVPVAKDSLIYVRDTAFMPMPREFKQYSGENYSAQVSGVDPTLDWININQKTAYIQNTITTRKKWSFGISVGPGVLYDGSIHGGIGAVAGLQYNF